MTSLVESFLGANVFEEKIKQQTEAVGDAFPSFSLFFMAGWILNPTVPFLKT